ncbi:BOC isoform 17, partial [Pan troglodytes]
QQQSDTSSLLRQTHLGNGYDPQSHQIMRAPMLLGPCAS